MQKTYPTILDFTKLRDKCLFCQSPLRARLTNFVGLTRKGSLPILNSPLKNGGFTFHLNHTTESYNVEADGAIDAEINKLILTLPESGTPIVDRHVAKAAFVDLRPHIELYCANKHCNNGYGLSSYPFEVTLLGTIPYQAEEWIISPLKLFLETFHTNTLIVQSDWLRKETFLYSSTDQDIDPIRVPILDFEEMGAEKTLNRVSTYRVFS